MWVVGAWLTLAPLSLIAVLVASVRMGDAFDVDLGMGEDDAYGPVFAAAYVGVTA